MGGFSALSRGLQPDRESAKVGVAQLPASVVTGATVPGGTLPSRKRFTISDGPRLEQYTTNGITDLAGAVDVTVPFQAALADAAAVSLSAYGSSKGCPVILPDQGIALVSGKLTLGEGVGIKGRSTKSSAIVIPSGVGGFNDNAVISNLTQDATQEFAFLEGFSLFGHSTQGTTQANGGSSTTVTDSTFTVTDASLPRSIGVASTTGYASNGTLTIGTTRWIYSSIVDSTHFGGCILMSAANVTISNGATVTAVTTNNVVGIQLVNVFGGSYLRDLWVSSFTGECILIAGRTNGFPFDNINAVHSNRDNILFTGHPQSMHFGMVLPQYCGENGSTDGDAAGLHILGPTGSGSTTFLGDISIGNMYSEQNAINASALWIQNCGGVSVGSLRLEGGRPPSTTTSGSQTLPLSTINVVSTTDSSTGIAFPSGGGTLQIGANNVVTYTGTSGGNSFTGCSGGSGTVSGGTAVALANQQAVRIDSAQTNPLTEDGCHSANISLRNVSVLKLGRTAIVDNVRSNVSPVSTSDNGHQITRYDTEDSSPGAVAPWLANHFYWANAIAYNAGTPYQRLTSGFSAATWGSDSANWTSLAGPADRMSFLRRGTVTSYRESFDRRAGGTQAFTTTSGLLIAAVVPVIAGDSFTQVMFTTHSTAATFGTNNDGHWWLGVYDDATGNTLLASTTDQGHTAIPASSNNEVAFQVAYTPAADTLVRVALMIYLGTGGSPIAPTLRASLPGGQGGGIYTTGLPHMAISGTSGITSGTPSSAFGTVSNLSNTPYMALVA